MFSPLFVLTKQVFWERCCSDEGWNKTQALSPWQDHNWRAGGVFFSFSVRGCCSCSCSYLHLSLSRWKPRSALVWTVTAASRKRRNVLPEGTTYSASSFFKSTRFFWLPPFCWMTHVLSRVIMTRLDWTHDRNISRFVHICTQDAAGCA